MATFDRHRWRTRLTIAAVIVVIVILAYLGGREIVAIKDRFTRRQTVAVTSPIDGMAYEVHNNYPDAAAAADTLAKINQRVIEIMRHLKKKYIKDATPDIALDYPERIKAVQRLLARYNPDNLAENSPFDPEGDTSYTNDKGALMALCLRNRAPRKGKKSITSINDGEIHPIDDLLFVTVHEMTHVAIDELDHPKVFWETFKFLLKETEKAHIAQFPNYKEYPVDYCGIVIDYNPIWDSTCRPIR